MHTFELYSQAWVVYILLGVLLLWLLDLKLRRRSIYLRVGLLTLIATGAFTPSTVGDATTHSPLIVAALFNAETNGVNEIYQALLLLLSVWGGVFALSLALIQFWMRRKTISDNKHDDSSEKENHQATSQSQNHGA